MAGCNHHACHFFFMCVLCSGQEFEELRTKTQQQEAALLTLLQKPVVGHNATDNTENDVAQPAELPATSTTAGADSSVGANVLGMSQVEIRSSGSSRCVSLSVQCKTKRRH